MSSEVLATKDKKAAPPKRGKRTSEAQAQASDDIPNSPRLSSVLT